MKTLLSLLFVLLPLLSYSQNVLFGKVIDATTEEPLVGVTIIIKGTSTGVITDFDGTFSITTELDTIDLVFSYISYQKITIERISLVGDLTSLPDIFMKEDILQAGEVVITADRIVKNETALIDMKMESNILLDGISSEKMKSTGDNNAVDASKRVTGVSVESGKYVYVRGLGDRYSKTLLNGIEIPGLDPDRNSLQMDIFPTNLLINIVVSKSFSPELPADFTGGLVNVETKDIPETQQGSFSFSLGYNPQVHLNPNFISEKGSMTDIIGFDGGTRRLPDELNRSYIPTPFNKPSNVSTTQHQQNIINLLNRLNPT